MEWDRDMKTKRPDLALDYMRCLVPGNSGVDNKAIASLSVRSLSHVCRLHLASLLQSVVMTGRHSIKVVAGSETAMQPSDEADYSSLCCGIEALEAAVSVAWTCKGTIGA